MKDKKTVIIGATPNPNRYAYIAAQKLKTYNHEIVPIGIKKGEVFGEPIRNLREKPKISGVDTITLYLNPTNQKEWEPYILSLNPKRIIFNPGTENPRLVKKAQENQIHTEYGCTLVMLSSGTY